MIAAQPSPSHPALPPSSAQAKARKKLHAPVRPEMVRGDAVFFDYRTLHRGIANESLRNR